MPADNFKRNRSYWLYLAAAFGGVVVLGVIWAIGRVLVKTMYEGRSWEFLNAMITGQGEHSLAEYYSAFNRVFVMGSVLAALVLTLAFTLHRNAYPISVWIKKNSYRIMVSLCLIFLAFLGGAVNAWYGSFPFEPWLRGAIIAGEAIYAQYVAPKKPFETDVWFYQPAGKHRAGVTKYESERAFHGYTLITVGQSALLLDMDGSVLHKWHVPYKSLETEHGTISTSAPDTWIYWKPAKLLRNGDLVALVDQMFTTPGGLALIRIDRNSRLEWIFPHHVHHDFDMGPDGNIYVLDQTIRADDVRNLDLEKPYLDEAVVVVSPNGEEIKRVSIIDAFGNSIYSGLFNELRINKKHFWGDYLHANSIDIVPPGMAVRTGVLGNGQVLLSLREMSTLATLDLEKRQVTWATPGPWRLQHDSQLLDNGNILLFDNRGDWKRGGHSRVIEFDPLDYGIVWEYPGKAGGSLNSSHRAGQQLLPNGNILITEFVQGRVLEVTRDGEIVWEYICPFRLEDNEDYVCRVMSAERYSPDAMGFKFNRGRLAG